MFKDTLKNEEIHELNCRSERSRGVKNFEARTDKQRTRN